MFQLIRLFHLACRWRYCLLSELRASLSCPGILPLRCAHLLRFLVQILLQQYWCLTDTHPITMQHARQQAELAVGADIVAAAGAAAAAVPAAAVPGGAQPNGKFCISVC